MHWLTPIHPGGCMIVVWTEGIGKNLRTRPLPAHQQWKTRHPCQQCCNNPNWDSSFAWLIATHQPLWQGEGAVPGPVEDAHTGWSEAYGLLTALWSPALPNDLLPSQNTDSILRQQQNGSHITSLLQEKPILRCSTILDDYDVYAEIVRATWSLHPLRVQYVHIKGHQDKNKLVHTLTKPAQYNINCNKRPTATLPNLAHLSTGWSTHPMPSSYPHLIIDCKTIVKDWQGALWHAAVTPAYRMYLQTKYQWTTTDAKEVN